MHEQSVPLVLDPTPRLLPACVKLLVLAVFLVLPTANIAKAQNLGAPPLFGSTSLEAGFSATPFTVSVSPGGEDPALNLGEDCYGYIRFAQPDFVLDYQAGESSLGVFALSDLDITMIINDPAGNWHCNDDSLFLSGTNSGIQFSDPLSGDYQIWVGSYDIGAESIVTLLAITEVDETEWASISVGLEEAVFAASFDPNGEILFGDDSSDFANDGECDDPRFQGPGAAFGSTSDHLFKDATDCRTQLEAGLISLVEPQEMNLSGDMDFSDNNADLFGGNIATASPLGVPDAGPVGEVIFALWQAFQAIPGDNAGAISLPFGIGGDTGPVYDRANMTALTGIDFGDNSGLFSDDGECDDPRFEGPGAAGFTFDEAVLTDAADCSSLYLEGLLSYVDTATVEVDMTVDSTGINFGDNSGIFADDGECDDPRFEGPGASALSSGASEMRDANDCRNLFAAGQVSLRAGTSNTSPSPPTVSTTTQASQPAATPEETYIIGTPRGDIDGASQVDGSIFASGTVYGDLINPGDSRRNRMPDTTNFAPTPTRAAPELALDFGDNSSVFANDGECDDPRFEGDGMSFASFDSNLGKDADDCRSAYEAGTITLIRD